jgi:hypothetical protein
MDAIFLRQDRFIWRGLLPMLFGMVAGTVLPQVAAQTSGRADRAPNVQAGHGQSSNFSRSHAAQRA